MKRYLMTAASVLTMTLAGCSDYPDTVEIDTRDYREDNEVHEVAGRIYGIAPEAETALKEQYLSGIYARRYIDSVINYVTDGEKGEAPEPDFPEYLGVSTSDFEDAATKLTAEIKGLVDKRKAELEEQIAEKEVYYADVKKELDDYKASVAAYKAGFADEEKKLAELEAEFEKLQKAYDEAHDLADKELTELASANGLSVSYDGNRVIGSYRNIDFNKRSDNPKNCPNYDAYVTVDIRDVNGLCAYLEVPRHLKKAGLAKEAGEIMSKHFIAMQKADAKLGEDFSWGQEKTGLYAAIDQAKDALSDARDAAYREANLGYGYESTLRYKKEDVNSAKAELDNLKSDEYMKEYVYDSRYLSNNIDDFRKAFETYHKQLLEAIEEDYLVDLGEIKTVKEGDIVTGVFDDLDSGYEGIVVVADVIMTTSYSSRKTKRQMEYIDLTDESLADADAIVFESDDREDRNLREGDNEKENLRRQLFTLMMDDVYEFDYQKIYDEVKKEAS